MATGRGHWLWPLAVARDPREDKWPESIEAALSHSSQTFDPLVVVTWEIEMPEM